VKQKQAKNRVPPRVAGTHRLWDRECEERAEQSASREKSIRKGRLIVAGFGGAGLWLALIKASAQRNLERIVQSLLEPRGAPPTSDTVIYISRFHSPNRRASSLFENSTLSKPKSSTSSAQGQQQQFSRCVSPEYIPGMSPTIYKKRSPCPKDKTQWARWFSGRQAQVFLLPVNKIQIPIQGGTKQIIFCPPGALFHILYSNIFASPFFFWFFLPFKILCNSWK